MQKNKNINLLLQLCQPIFNFAYQLQKTHLNHAAKLRESAINIVNNFKQIATNKEISPAHIDACIYALVALIDELALSSDSLYRIEWMAKPIQLEFYNEHLAGEGFYTRLNNLRQNAAQNIDVLEIYYICTELGFAGMYRKSGMEKFEAFKVNLRAQINSIRGDIPETFTLSLTATNPLIASH